MKYLKLFILVMIITLSGLTGSQTEIRTEKRLETNSKEHALHIIKTYLWN